MNWCRRALARVVPVTPTRVALFCSLLALASLRCISDFLVTPGAGAAPALRLAFQSAPRESTPGHPLTVRIALKDTAGNDVDDLDATVTIRLVGGPAGASLGGPRTATVADGVAEFRGLVLDSAGRYRLAAAANEPGIAPDTSGTIVVAWPPVKELRLSPDEHEFDAFGDTVTVRVEARADDGRVIPAPPLTWTSSNDSVATVAARGQVTARGSGEARVRARAGTAEAGVDIEVRPRVVRIVIEPAELTLPLYQSAILTATAYDRSGNVIPGVALSWSSSRDRSVTVTRVAGEPWRAVARRWRSGEATITARRDDARGSAIVR